MISRAAWLLALLGCGADAPSPRARVLDKLPVGASTIAVADGRALAKLRGIVDVLRAEVPAGFDCVLDAAVGGQATALGIDARGNITVALATRADVKCPALSAVEAGLYIATLGTGTPGAGAAALAEHPRARPFLVDAPIAIVTRLGAIRVIGTAQPEPLAAWVAFDAADGAAAVQLQRTLEARLAKLPVTIDRMGSQVVARLLPTRDDIAALLRTALSRPRTDTRGFACPAAIAPPVLACAARERDQTTLDVYSLASATDELIEAKKELVIANGRPAGVRFATDLAAYGLASGDLVVAVDGQPLTAVDQLGPALRRAKVHVRLLVSRARQVGTIELVEH